MRLARWGVGAALVALAACAAARPEPPPEPAPPWPASVDDLGWLVGDWVGRGPAGTCFVERWFPPAADTLLGVGRHEREGRVQVRETMRVMREADGGLVLVIMLDHGQVTRFAIRREGQTAFVARREGPGWPGAIAYRFGPADALLVRLGDEGEERVDLELTRVAARDAVCAP